MNELPHIKAKTESTSAFFNSLLTPVIIIYANIDSLTRLITNFTALLNHKTMKVFATLIFSFFLITSCNESTSQSSRAVANSSVVISIQGMTCEKMCGGTVRKGLEKLKGVNSTELAFNPENPIDLVTVNFDSSKVSAEEMKEKVESIAGGIYKVKEIN
ncbi:MAG: copper chaperone CopZ [Saprospiraceae bacterium]|jgi:copper chaperone CopZ|tara:strand:+ start:647 stop:1123 length:477 start_codon:yes stop_codon:yes gene_type:complete